MDSLHSFVRFAPSECGLLLRRVLFGLCSPVIHGPQRLQRKMHERTG
jgi:hypothetical protein